MFSLLNKACHNKDSIWPWEIFRYSTKELDCNLYSTLDLSCLLFSSSVVVIICNKECPLE